MSKFEGALFPGEQQHAFGSGLGFKLGPDSSALTIFKNPASVIPRGISDHLLGNDDQDEEDLWLSNLNPENCRSVGRLGEEFQAGSSLPMEGPVPLCFTPPGLDGTQAIAAGNNHDEDGGILSILNDLPSLIMGLMAVSAVPMTALW